jgi:hypothetical protein
MANEFARTGIVTADREPHKVATGIAMFVMNVGGLIALLAIPLAIAGLAGSIPVG